jgi:hypothetical protein
MLPMMSLTDLLEATNQLSVAEHESLITLLQQRLRERQQAPLIQTVQTARWEFQQGLCQPATPSEILKEILS